MSTPAAPIIAHERRFPSLTEAAEASLRSDSLDFPLTLPLPEAADQSRLRVGDLCILAPDVRVPPDTCMGEAQYYGRLATVVEDDNSDVPFSLMVIVGENIGECGWFPADVLRRYGGPPIVFGMTSLLKEAPAAWTAPPPVPGSFPVPLPLPIAADRRPAAGELVVLAAKTPFDMDTDMVLGASQADGRVARVIALDNTSATPFRVQLLVGPPERAGRTSWYGEGTLAVYTGPSDFPYGLASVTAAAADATFPVPLPLPLAPTSRRPEVGELVALADRAAVDGSLVLGASQADGRLGRVVADDKSSTPFQVELVVGPPDRVGQLGVYREGQIAHWMGPAPTAGLESVVAPGTVAPAGAPRPEGFPLALPLPVAAGRRPTEGDLVVISAHSGGHFDASNVMGGTQADGRLGRVIVDDHSGRPYQVQLVVGPLDRIGDSNWYNEEDVAVYAGPAPAPGMTSLVA